MKANSKQLVLWSPGVKDHAGSASDNVGDLIIEESVKQELKAIFPNWTIETIATHQRLTPVERNKIRKSALTVIGGSNLLSSYMDGYFQWDLTLANAIAARGSILLGAGWWRDQGQCNRYTKILLSMVLSRKFIHSVRDSQAEQHLRSIHIPKVVNTACPTMWPLARMDLKRLPIQPAANVLCMLTDYLKEPEVDQAFLNLLMRNYSTVYIWPQGAGDLTYIKDLSFDGTILEQGLASLDELLASEVELDYVGTRLHGGVRCLRAGKRSLIIEVDNRAREVNRDTGLPTVERADLEGIEKWTKGSEPVAISLPEESIASWKAQFKGLA
jgi:polysaccharide pyruvyl transferase WcaK-like protein